VPEWFLDSILCYSCAGIEKSYPCCTLDIIEPLALPSSRYCLRLFCGVSTSPLEYSIRARMLCKAEWISSRVTNYKKCRVNKLEQVESSNLTSSWKESSRPDVLGNRSLSRTWPFSPNAVVYCGIGPLRLMSTNAWLIKCVFGTLRFLPRTSSISWIRRGFSWVDLYAKNKYHLQAVRYQVLRVISLHASLAP